MKESRQRKEANRRLNSKVGSIPFNSEKKKHIVNELE